MAWSWEQGRRMDKLAGFGTEDSREREELVGVKVQDELENNEALGEVDGALGLVGAELEDGDFERGIDVGVETVGLVLEVDLELLVRSLQ